jgi:hypothetical protein
MPKFMPPDAFYPAEVIVPEASDIEFDNIVMALWEEETVLITMPDMWKLRNGDLATK